jgi:hypothetical protein
MSKQPRQRLCRECGARVTNPFEKLHFDEQHHAAECNQQHERKEHPGVEMQTEHDRTGKRRARCCVQCLVARGRSAGERAENRDAVVDLRRAESCIQHEANARCHQRCTLGEAERAGNLAAREFLPESNQQHADDPGEDNEIEHPCDQRHDPVLVVCPP